MGNNKVYLKRITIITIIVFGVFFSFKAFYNAFVNDYDKATSLIKGSFNYNLDEPDDKIKLDNKYEEISGLEYKDGIIYFVTDEVDEIGAINPYTHQFISTGGNTKGDFEGIAFTDTQRFLVTSKGTLYTYLGEEEEPSVKYFIQGKGKTNGFEKCNVEGLCFDKQSNRLLVACKGKPYGDIEKDHRGIYMYDLWSGGFRYQAVYDISNKDVFGDKRKKKDQFGPSGIAVHPITGYIYIIAHVGKVIFALNREGKVVRSKRLDPDIFKQPEGICFNERGDMYISNEGRGGKANILYFKYKTE